MKADKDPLSEHLRKEILQQFLLLFQRHHICQQESGSACRGHIRKNSWTMLLNIRLIRLEKEYKLVSYDVENCFGTIPVELAIKIIREEFDKVESYTNIPCDRFIKLIEFCMCECNYFVFENQFYQQEIGLFMGSALSSILVERVIEKAVDETMINWISICLFGKFTSMITSLLCLKIESSW
ncbi:hypothetical protein Bhyg_03002 [Pseudolycoriella hygida]|uniref:Reverse transcriptase domain-containing protein n=1 Tax=Pseudolycoriella hygida TaxID=35572 RepID=A0A9Q0NEC5_9DIPT|nr:hypothetical protein Bhyg_03002 [Pseudolycoriella hygida]